MDFIDTYRTFFSHAHRTFSNVDQLLGHKTNLSKFEKNESITNIFYNHNVMRIEINYKKKKNCIKIKNTNSRWLNNLLLKTNGSLKKSKRKYIYIYLETNDNENMMIQKLWNRAKAVFSNTCLPQKTNKKNLK